jgi:hypothetical protein
VRWTAAVLVSVLVGVWFIAAEAMFFWLLYRFRARDGQKAQYITGKEKHLKQWINIPHALVLVCDVVIIIAAVRVWVLIKQTLPPLTARCGDGAAGRGRSRTRASTAGSTRPTTSARPTSCTSRSARPTTSCSSRRTSCTASSCPSSA